MITLREAMKLLKIKDSEEVYFRKRGNQRLFDGLSFGTLHGKEIKEKLDMRKIKVLGIDTVFGRYDGEFWGMEFEVEELPKHLRMM